MFSSRLPLAERYAELLATAGVERGLIGPREAPRLWERHLINCAVVETLLPQDASVCDVGSGAGLPGVVLAIVRPDLRVTLVEPLLRRAGFLTEVVETLSLDRVTVIRSRAEELHGSVAFDAVTSRAVAPLERLLGWSMPLVAPRGAVLAMKGSTAHAEVDDVGGMARRRGWSEPEVVTVGQGGSSTGTVVRVTWADPASVSWPPVPQPGARRTSSRRRR